MAGRFPLLAGSIAGALTLCLAGCASSPHTRFYTLHPVGERQVERTATPAAPVSVFVRPVDIPDYLDRPQIVTRSGHNELVLAEFDRWAGSLADDITAVVAEDLSRLLGTERVYSNRSVQGEKADYTVALRILRLDCTPGESVFMRAQWLVRCPGEGKSVSVQGGTFTAPVKDRQYQTVVAAVSKVLEQVSIAIARDIAPAERAADKTGAPR
ncbi:ABC-type transport auxiliary lipoprotein family protein [Geomonas sp. RF6]|uniref:PqiC family protein n=1 Tax=Geomonas sp. RF6 TaxID=2897342 RepID=UPI001E4FAF53|nr:PqiC family protein [Geomonas sp. RF6]UFS70651.1 ABC-type transport auxiliary lipoprotein family protein [Geomonas sp. RF6]